MPVVIFDNRSTQDTPKSSMTDKLIKVLGAFAVKKSPLPLNTTFLVLSGSSRCISRGEIYPPATKVIQEAIDKQIPILGICYGFQMIAHVYGYTVERLPDIVREQKHVEGVGSVLFHHGDRVVGLPPLHQFSKKVFGVQFHPESSPDGVAWLQKHISAFELN